MGSIAKATNANGLKPVAWAAVEPEFRAGIRSLRSIGTEHGVTPAAILKHFGKRGVTRDLKARIVAQAQAKVNAAAVNEAVNTEFASRAHAVVEDQSDMVAAIVFGHRKLCVRARRLTQLLLAELEAVTEQPEFFARVRYLLENLDDEPTSTQRQELRDMAALVSSLPQRVKVMKDLADTLHRVIGVEREACGLDTVAGTDGRPMVILRDFTGRGDVDSPAQEAA